jgi:hypothetical protein
MKAAQVSISTTTARLRRIFEGMGIAVERAWLVEARPTSVREADTNTYVVIKPTEESEQLLTSIMLDDLRKRIALVLKPENSLYVLVEGRENEFLRSILRRKRQVIFSGTHDERLRLQAR